MAKFKSLEKRLTKDDKILKKKLKQHFKDRTPSMRGETIGPPDPIAPLRSKYRTTGAYYGISGGLPTKVSRAAQLAKRRTVGDTSDVSRVFEGITGKERPQVGSVGVPLKDPVGKWQISRKDRRRRPFYATLGRNPFAYFKPGPGGRGANPAAILKQFERASR